MGRNQSFFLLGPFVLRKKHPKVEQAVSKGGELLVGVRQPAKARRMLEFLRMFTYIREMASNPRSHGL